MNNAFYFVFATADEAADCLPNFESDEAKRQLAEAEAHRQREQESFERSDTDGCVSQWCSDISARECGRAAELANRANLTIDAALMDVATGEILTACVAIRPNNFASWKTDFVWIFERNGKREYVTDYKKESMFAAKGLRKVYVLVPAKLMARSPKDSRPEQRGLSGLASYSGKYPYPDYSSCGLPL